MTGKRQVLAIFSLLIFSIKVVRLTPRDRAASEILPFAPAMAFTMSCRSKSLTLSFKVISVKVKSAGVSAAVTEQHEKRRARLQQTLEPLNNLQH